MKRCRRSAGRGRTRGGRLGSARAARGGGQRRRSEIITCRAEATLRHPPLSASGPDSNTRRLPRPPRSVTVHLKCRALACCLGLPFPPFPLHCLFSCPSLPSFNTDSPLSIWFPVLSISGASHPVQFLAAKYFTTPPSSLR